MISLVDSDWDPSHLSVLLGEEFMDRSPGPG